MSQAKFSIGQVVRHNLFDYRGVIYDVDFHFMGSEEWYEHVALSRPPKDRPWYHVLVDQSWHETYVAERNLEVAEVQEPISHPEIDRLFADFRDGAYILKTRQN